jgi:cell division protein FtsI (penicillin-binding protein 3)
VDEARTQVQPPVWEPPSKALQSRLWIFQVAILLLFAIVALRLIQIQIIDAAKYRDMALKQYQARIALPATRGSLFDRHGAVIASNAMYVSFAADPELAADDARAIATTFSKLFGKSRSFYLDKLHSDSRFVWLERQVDPAAVKKIDAKELDGLVTRNETRRLYFCDNLAGQFIGCTDVDNRGIAGIEKYFDDKMRGQDGYVIFERDGHGVSRPTVDYPRVEPVSGHNIYLTIDTRLQAIAEKELKNGVEQNRAESGIVVMLRPTTGEILALAQYPGVDPNAYNKSEQKDQKLRAVTDCFEPGSVFKIVTASAAIENSLVTPEQKFFAENGTWLVPVANGKPRKITDTHKAQWLTFREALEQSSNIVMAKVSNLIGSERLYRMARDYGFGTSTGLEYPGEVNGTLKKPSEWSGTTLNTLAYGYEVGVTPIQLASAYAAVANGGILLKPYIVQKETEANGTMVRESSPQVIRRVVSPSTARLMKEFFVGVVERGTGKPAAIPGVKVAGKTGTSRKFGAGHYEQGSYTASFVGFFPADDPRLLCLVMIDNPHGSSYYGGTVSAPVFRAIAEKSMLVSDLFAPVMPLRGDSLRQDSVPRRPIDSVLEEKPAFQQVVAGIIPDVRGWTIRRAMALLSEAKFVPVVNGTGVVIAQSPAAGQPAKAGTVVTLTCQSKPVTASLNLN